MDLAQGALGLLRLGHAEVNQLVSIMDSLAQGLLAPTVSNAKMVAQSVHCVAFSCCGELLVECCWVVWCGVVWCSGCGVL